MTLEDVERRKPASDLFADAERRLGLTRLTIGSATPQSMVRFVTSIGLIAVLAAGVLALPIEVPYRVSGAGIVMPAQEWLLLRQADGSVGTLLRDHIGGSTSSSDLHRFERGDAVEYRLDPSVGWRTAVTAGDTILRIRSNEAERRFAALTGDLAAARSAVSLHASGEKRPLVEQAERRLDRVREQVLLAEKNVDRLRRLAERRLVAEQELDVAESRLEVLEAEVAIAQAGLEAVQTGAKPEQLDLARTEAEAHRRELAAVAERLDHLTIRSPISGLAVRSYGADTLLTIRDTSAAVVVMPIPWKDTRHLAEGQSVRADMREIPVSLHGQIVQLGDTIHRLRGQQVVMVTVLVNTLPEEPVVGALAECVIETAPVRIFEFVKRKVM